MLFTLRTAGERALSDPCEFAEKRMTKESADRKATRGARGRAPPSAFRTRDVHLLRSGRRVSLPSGHYWCRDRDRALLLDRTGSAREPGKIERKTLGGPVSWIFVDASP